MAKSLWFFRLLTYLFIDFLSGSWFPTCRSLEAPFLSSSIFLIQMASSTSHLKSHQFLMKWMAADLLVKNRLQLLNYPSKNLCKSRSALVLMVWHLLMCFLVMHYFFYACCWRIFFCVMEFCTLKGICSVRVRVLIFHLFFIPFRVLVFVIMYVYLVLVDVECCTNQIISTLAIFLRIDDSYQYRSNNSAIYCR